MSKLSVFLIRLATDPEVRDQYRDPKTRQALIDQFVEKKALTNADVKALEAANVSKILASIAASNQQTDGTAIRVRSRGHGVAKRKKAGKAKKKK